MFKLIIIIFSLFYIINPTWAASRCSLMISAYEQEYNIPRNLLCAIATVESRLNPYAIYHSGKSYFFKNKQEAKSFIDNLIEQGENNFDVGLMQINYKYHGHKFGSLDEMLHPETNVIYAAKFLNELKEKYSEWRASVAHYHSSKAEYQNIYTAKVLKSWLGL